MSGLVPALISGCGTGTVTHPETDLDARDEVSATLQAGPGAQPVVVPAALDPTPEPDPDPTPVATEIVWLTEPHPYRYDTNITGTVLVRDSDSGVGVIRPYVRRCRRNDTQEYGCSYQGGHDDGRVNWQIRAHRTVSVVFYYDATDDFAASESAVQTFPVAPKVRVTHPRHSRVKVSIAPHARQRVNLERWNGHRWVRCRHTRTNRHGKATFAHLPRHRYRVHVPATAELTGTHSHPLRVR